MAHERCRMPFRLTSGGAPRQVAPVIRSPEAGFPHDGLVHARKRAPSSSTRPVRASLEYRELPTEFGWFSGLGTGELAGCLVMSATASCRTSTRPPCSTTRNASPPFQVDGWRSSLSGSPLTGCRRAMTLGVGRAQRPDRPRARRPSDTVVSDLPPCSFTEASRSEQPVISDTARRRLGPASPDAVRAYAAQTLESADQFRFGPRRASPPNKLRRRRVHAVGGVAGAAPARLGARPAPDVRQPNERQRARVAFCEAAAKTAGGAHRWSRAPRPCRSLRRPCERRADPRRRRQRRNSSCRTLAMSSGYACWAGITAWRTSTTFAGRSQAPIPLLLG